MEQSTTPAGFWHRYAAYSIDFIIIGALATLLTWRPLQTGLHDAGAAFAQLRDGMAQQVADGMLDGTPAPVLAHALLADPRVTQGADAVQAALWHASWPWLLAYAVLAAVWHLAGERSRWGGSFGKHLLGLQVRDRSGSALSWPRCVVRHVAALASWLTGNLGHALAAVPPQKRALHDYVAGARVDTVDGATMPAWAKAWVALQLVVMVVVPLWIWLRFLLSLSAQMQ